MRRDRRGLCLRTIRWRPSLFYISMMFACSYIQLVFVQDFITTLFERHRHSLSMHSYTSRTYAAWLTARHYLIPRRTSTLHLSSLKPSSMCTRSPTTFSMDHPWWNSGPGRCAIIPNRPKGSRSGLGRVEHNLRSDLISLAGFRFLIKHDDESVARQKQILMIYEAMSKVVHSKHSVRFGFVIMGQMDWWILDGQCEVCPRISHDWNQPLHRIHLATKLSG